MGSPSSYNIYVGDLHLGNAYADVMTFVELTRRMRRKLDAVGAQINECILLGDVIDGMDKYETQPYKQMPETLRVQRESLKWLFEFLKQELEPKSIVLVLGNHDSDFRGVLFDVELLEKVYPFVKVVRIYVDELGMLCVHQLSRSSRFGSQSGWTPSMVAKAKDMILGEMRRSGKEIRGLVTAHVHKILDILRIGADTLILLPAFLHPGREVAESIMYEPAIVAYDGSSLIIESKPFNDMEKIVETSSRFYAEIMRDRSRALSVLENGQREGVTSPNKSEVLMSRYGSWNYKISREEVERFKELYDKLGSVSAVARLMGISKNRAYAIRKLIETKD